MAVTLKDVAKEAGVSFCLVSKYVNRHPSSCMSDETRRKIADAVERLHYQPSLTARALRSGRTRTIGLVIGNLTNSFFAHFADESLRLVQEAGYQLLIALYRNESEKNAALQNLFLRQVDAVFSPEGIILNRSGELESPHLEGFGKAIEKGISVLEKADCHDISALFFEHSIWKNEFVKTIQALNFPADFVQIDFDERLRLEQLRNVCKKRPSSIFCSGWQTTSMLTELLNREFPDYHPKLLLRANCCGAFLENPNIAGAVYHSETSLIRSLIGRILSILRKQEKADPLTPVPMEFLNSSEMRLKGMVEGHFRLT